MPIQLDWRFCIKCHAMFFNGFADTGTCPAGGGHNAEGLIFGLPHDEPPSATAQPDWRFCGKCKSMFFSGFSGACAAGGGHDAQGVNFVLPHDVPPSGTAQPDWHFCDKCSSMFFDAANSRCPAGGGHHAQGHNFVLPHTGTSGPPTLHLWTDSLRCHSETPGGGIFESDEPYVLVAVFDFERRNAAGVPATDVVLYGPLDDVDDQENHSFPFRPFWIAPLRPESAVFLTAILENDNVNPETIRTAVSATMAAVAVATSQSSRAKVVSEGLSAMSGAAQPFIGPALDRLIGPPAELVFTADDMAKAAVGDTARQVLRYSGHGDFSVHYLARRN